MGPLLPEEPVLPLGVEEKRSMNMLKGVEHPAQVANRIKELTAEFGGWRIGRGGSGHWWAIRGNEIVRSLNVEDLRSRLRELSMAHQRA